MTLPIFSQFNCDDLSSQTSYPNTKRTANEELIQQKHILFIFIYSLFHQDMTLQIKYVLQHVDVKCPGQDKHQRDRLITHTEIHTELISIPNVQVIMSKMEKQPKYQ